MHHKKSTQWGFEIAFEKGETFFQKLQYTEAVQQYRLALDSIREKDLRHPIVKQIMQKIRLGEIFSTDKVNQAISGLVNEQWEEAHRLSTYLKALDPEIWSTTLLCSGEKIIREQSLWVFTSQSFKCGIRKLDGKIIYPPIYDFIFPVQHGRILTCTQGQWFFRDRKMKKLHLEPLQQAQFHPSGIHPVKRKGAYNLFDHRAKPIFDLWSPRPLIYTGTFPIPYQKGKYWGFKDKRNKWVIEPKFLKSYPFSNELARVVTETDVHGFIDEKGDWVIEPRKISVGDFHDGYAAFKKQNKWGFIDKKGQMVIPPIFEKVVQFNSGYCPVQIAGLWTLIDHSARERFKPKFTSIKPQRKGLFYKATTPKGEVQTINIWGTPIPDLIRENTVNRSLDSYVPE